jgi:cytochrome c-type biogenesis protein
MRQWQSMSGELTLGVAFLAGLGSFFAPCVLPVVPAYLGFVTGGAEAARSVRLLRTVAFVLGFGAAFVVLGIAIGAAASSGAFRDAETWLARLGGVLIIAFGLAMLGLLRVPFLDRDLRYHGAASARVGRTGGAALLGAAFGVGWTPCVGPILAGILVLAGLSGGVASSAALLGVYAFGLAVPFLVLGVLADRGSAALKRFRRVSRSVEVVGGVLLLVLGVAVFTGSAARLQSLVIG